MNVNIGEKLKLLRDTYKMTQPEVASKSGIEPNTYGRYERGERYPTAQNVKKLAEVFNCTTDYLLGLTDEPNLVNWTDLPEELTSEGIEALEITREALAEGLSAQDIKDIIEMALKLKKKD